MELEFSEVELPLYGVLKKFARRKLHHRQTRRHEGELHQRYLAGGARLRVSRDYRRQVPAWEQ